jgi:Na+-driven multidrug efflux pump
LLIGLAAHGADGVINGYNVGIGRPEFNSYTALAGLVVTIGGDVLLIPQYSLIGAAVASSAAYTVKSIAMTVIFLSTSGVSFRQLLGFEEYLPDAA